MPSFDIDIKVNTESEELNELKNSLDEISMIADGVSSSLSDIDTTAMDELGTSADGTANSIGDLDGSLNSMDSTGVDETASSVGGLNEEISNATQGANELGNSLGIIESGALLQISQQIGAIGDGAENMAQGLENTQITIGQLATNTGMAEGEMSKLIQYISNVTFPQEEAMAYVGALNQMNVSNDKLGASATNMDRINDATGMGYNNVITLTQGLRSMGVEADKLPSSFNAIAYAQANITGGASTFGTILKRQAPTINEYGLNIDQVAVLMKHFSDAGYSNMKIGSEMSKVLKENDGDLSAVEKELGMTSGALSNASNETGKYSGKLMELANQEMEHKTILERLQDAWSDISLQIAPVLTPLSSFIGLIGQAGSFAVGINGLIQLKNTIMQMNMIQGVTGKLSSLKAGFMTVGASAKASMMNILSFSKSLIVNTISAVKNATISFASLAKEVLLSGYNALKSGAMWLIQKAQLIATTIAEYATTAAQWALNLAMEANPIGIILIALTALIGLLGYLYFNNEQVRQAVDGLVGALTGFVGYVIGTVQSVLGQFIGWLQQLFGWLNTAGGSITGVIDGVIAYVMGIIGQIQNILNTIWVNIQTWFTFLLTMTPQQVFQLIIGVITALNPFAGMIFNSLSRVLPVFISSATSWITNTVSRASQLVGNVVNTIGQLPNRISSALSGVANAIISPFQRAYNMVKPILDAFQQGLDWAKELLGMDAGLEGFDGNFYYGNTSSVSTPSSKSSVNNTLDNYLVSNKSNKKEVNVNNNFNINGIIEEEASDYIVNSVNDYIRKQNIIRGV